MIELKGDGDWQFDGMYDAHKKGAASCELGHPLRYVYRARNKKMRLATEEGTLPQKA